MGDTHSLVGKKQENTAVDKVVESNLTTGFIK